MNLERLAYLSQLGDQQAASAMRHTARRARAFVWTKLRISSPYRNGVIPSRTNTIQGFYAKWAGEGCGDGEGLFVYGYENGNGGGEGEYTENGRGDVGHGEHEFCMSFPPQFRKLFVHRP